MQLINGIHKAQFCSNEWLGSSMDTSTIYMKIWACLVIGKQQKRWSWLCIQQPHLGNCSIKISFPSINYPILAWGINVDRWFGKCFFFHKELQYFQTAVYSKPWFGWDQHHISGLIQQTSYLWLMIRGPSEAAALSVIIAHCWRLITARFRCFEETWSSGANTKGKFIKYALFPISSAPNDFQRSQ